ncbi:hybrid sensor histidine kinase/response regulator [Collimonas sp. OK412]|jgi:two-component system sensor histidine kinase and response regulator WspE|uniref:hybrid sensor histidine kinase/response regulator n=1 Tax=Collimonas sp. (strain OK412) TaxID=1801619 RepID=UPI0008EE4E70|nr:hybrid sensor histidine kinase/response regulator [Collimonas sp. OK412]SFB92122.1 two-component system, chemotaxis family, sensor histidine kinase and response regulator WspE [Collimonas sp. OK412]
MNADDMRDASMLDLFRLEVDTQAQVMSSGLLAIERAPSPQQLEACMRAAHSIKGAARIVGIQAGVDVTHVMEDCFVSAQQGKIQLGPRRIDQLLHGVDLLQRIAASAEDLELWQAGSGRKEIETFLRGLENSLQQADDRAREPEAAIALAATEADEAMATADEAAPGKHLDKIKNQDQGDRMLRVTAAHLNQLVSLSGESLVESRWLPAFNESLLRLKRLQQNTAQSLEVLHDSLREDNLAGDHLMALQEVRQHIDASQKMLAERLAELELFERRNSSRAQRLYDQALASRMRPFADRVVGYDRMVRDLGRTLGKQVKLEINGQATQVDRDILEQLDAPLVHLLRNALDHGIEAPPQRRAAGKDEEGLITLTARHHAGLLQITISDDGNGVDLEQLRAAVVRRGLVDHATASRLSDTELLHFLLLPGFSMRDTVTEISGRGVGLDVVHNMLKRMRGTIQIFSEAGHGMRFQLQLPLTLSLVRSLLVSIGGEPYAFPLAYVNRTMILERSQIESLEGRQHFAFEDRQIGLVAASQILQSGDAAPGGDRITLVVIGDQVQTYGLQVDRLLGEHMLVVQPLDARLGKIKDVAAAALMEDGAPVLILDVADMLNSVEKLIAQGQLSKIENNSSQQQVRTSKRVLVVDDSLTVRELERKLLSSRGYTVRVAVDGMDGWNALRSEPFDLVVTDIDMPRMDGIELVTLIKKNLQLKAIPVMIVSYKDRQEDRQRGLEAGADYYLAKASFHDETLLQAVEDLIGEAHS